jgi:hypothetical protein
MRSCTNEKKAARRSPRVKFAQNSCRKKHKQREKKSKN